MGSTRASPDGDGTRNRPLVDSLTQRAQALPYAPRYCQGSLPVPGTTRSREGDRRARATLERVANQRNRQINIGGRSTFSTTFPEPVLTNSANAGGSNF